MKNLLFSAILFTFLASCNTKDVKIENEEKLENVDEQKIETVNSSEETELEKAPDFNLPDLNGNKKSLADFRGKLIYLDIWATWCGPCRMQIPAMKELEKKYRDKEIVFLSVSVDPEKDKNKWKQMIKDEQMSGEHLYAGVKSSSFGFDYKVEFIPRFILISPFGEILIPHAPQPMDMSTGGINPEIENIFDVYLKANQIR